MKLHRFKPTLAAILGLVGLIKTSGLALAQDQAQGLAIEGDQPSQIGRRLFTPKRRWNETDEEIQAKQKAQKAEADRVQAAEATRAKEAAELASKQSGGASGSAVTAGPSEQKLSMIIGRDGFFPKTIYLKRDIPTILYVTASSKDRHCIFLDDFQIKRQIKSETVEEIRILPSIPGKYRIHCPMNDAEATLLVKE